MNIKDKNVEDKYWSNEYRVWLVQYYTFSFTWVSVMDFVGGFNA